MLSRFDKEADRLSKLPRAQRFAELIQFPATHMFKVIGTSTDLSNHLNATLTTFGYENIIVVERPSSQGRFTAFTFSLHVDNSTRLDELYSAFEQLPGVRFLF